MSIKIFALAFIIIFIETFSYFVLKSMDGNPKKTQDLLYHYLKTSKELIKYHPYLGYSYNGEKEFTYDKNFFNIAVIGGSVAEHFGYFAKKKNEKFFCNGKKVKFTNFAKGGYRQPQQLIFYNLYQDSADLFISLEGFNELFIIGASCSPSSWTRYANKHIERNGMKITLYKYLIKIFKSTIMSGYQLSNYSQTIKIFMALTNKKLKLYLDYFVKQRHSSINKSCNKKYQRNEETLWLKYLFHSHKMAKSFNSNLLTFIQPNQYYANRKPWSQAELKIFENSYFHENMNSMQEKIDLSLKKIKNKNYNNIIDLTNVFSDNLETLYIDDCCHLNSKGNSILYQKIKKHIVSKFCNK